MIRGILLAMTLLGLAGHFAVNPMVAWAEEQGWQAGLEAISTPPVPPGSNQNSRLEHSFAGEKPLAPGTLAYHQQRIRLSWARAWLLGLVLVGVALLSWRRAEVKQRLQEVFAEKDHPLTLALLRIAVFGVLLSRFDLERWLWFTDLPRALALPPPGLAWVLSNELVSREVASALGPVFLLCCFMAMIGLFSRASAGMAILLGLYIWGIPKVFGATMFQHSLFWLGALCAVAPSGDALSIDALWRAWRRPAATIAGINERSRTHAWAARIGWMFFALLYFFPGWWKLWDCGFDFAFSDNLASVMHGRWADFGGKVPWLRVDKVPPMMWGAGLSVLLFELAFPFAMFSRRLRPFLLLEGAFFHVMNLVVLYIDFLHMVYCYVMFIDVRKWLQWAGTKIYRSPMELGYDAKDAGGHRAAALLKTLDLLDVVKPVSAAGFYVTVGSSRREGMAAVWLLCRRVPLLLLVVPLLWWCLARSRPPVVEPPEDELRLPRAGRRVLALGAFICSAGFVAGSLELDQGWPFACYPPFGWISGPYRHSVRLVATADDGTLLPYDERVIVKRLSGNWSAQLMGFVLLTQDPALREQRLRALWQLFLMAEPRLSSAASVRLDAVTLLLDPEQKQPQVLEQTLLLIVK